MTSEGQEFALAESLPGHGRLDVEITMTAKLTMFTKNLLLSPFVSVVAFVTSVVRSCRSASWLAAQRRSNLPGHGLPTLQSR